MLEHPNGRPPEAENRPVWHYLPISYSLTLNEAIPQLRLPIHQPLSLSPYFVRQSGQGHFGIDIVTKHVRPIDIEAELKVHQGGFSRNWRLENAYFVELFLNGSVPQGLDLRQIPLFSYQPGRLTTRIVPPHPLRNNQLILQPSFGNIKQRFEFWRWAQSTIRQLEVS